MQRRQHHRGLRRSSSKPRAAMPPLIKQVCIDMSGSVKGLTDNLVQVAKARGHRSIRNRLAITYLIAGKLNLRLQR